MYMSANELLSAIADVEEKSGKTEMTIIYNSGTLNTYFGYNFEQNVKELKCYVCEKFPDMPSI